MSEGSMKEMGGLLRRGARMMSEACPECGTPLFRLKSGEIVCPSCNRPVKIIKGDEAPESLAPRSSLEASLRRKIAEVQAMMEDEKDAARIREYTDTLVALLGALEKAKNLGA
jgi:UPF0148 protein